MIKEVLSVITNPTFLLVTVGVITLLAAIALVIIELKFKFEFKKKKKFKLIYFERLEKVHKSKKSTSKKMQEINNVAKDFFHDAYQTSTSANYSQLIKTFRKVNDEEAQKFCGMMLRIYYTQQKFTDRKIKSVVIELSNLIRKKKYLLIKDRQ